MRMHTPASTTLTDDREQRRRLGKTLLDAMQGLLAAHERLHECAERREGALRAGDMEQLASVIERENAVVAEIARLDRQRADAATQLAPEGAGDTLTIHDVAPALDAQLRERVLAVAASLRARIEALHEKNAALQSAASALARHAQGLLREAESRLNHSGAYSEKGVVAAGPPVLSAVDITT